jgi:hypothetical protein
LAIVPRASAEHPHRPECPEPLPNIRAARSAQSLCRAPRLPRALPSTPGASAVVAATSTVTTTTTTTTEGAAIIALLLRRQLLRSTCAESYFQHCRISARRSMILWNPTLLLLSLLLSSLLFLRRPLLRRSEQPHRMAGLLLLPLPRRPLLQRKEQP